MKILGIKNLEFIGKDGKKVEGQNIYCGELITKGGNGYQTEKFFLSKKKLQDLGAKLEVGDEIEVLYNKYGKVAGISLVEV